MRNILLVQFTPKLIDFYFPSGGTIHYDYDNSGNRLIRYIISLNKGNKSGVNTSKESFVDANEGQYKDKTKVTNVNTLFLKMHEPLLPEKLSSSQT